MSKNKKMVDSNIAIIGAGPAGLGAAYELVKNGIKSVVFDRNKEVGGLARTDTYKGYRFDVGPHRFFTKNEEVHSLWREILKDDFIKVKRLTRIYYNGKFFNYPIKAINAFFGLGFLESCRILISYLDGKIKFYRRPPLTFEDWMIKNFGRELYSIFFKTYTEKVWGIQCSELGAEWASQRIKNLNLAAALRDALWNSNNKKAKSLIEEFEYPINGAGMLCEKIRNYIERKGASVNVNTIIKKIHHNGKKILAITSHNKGVAKKEKVDYLFSSQPITDFIKNMEPNAPQKILAAADKLYYRDHITVNLIIEKRNIFPDQWIYIHDSRVKMARVTNYSNFSNQMSPYNQYAPISIEYFTFRNKERLWNAPDQELIRLAIDELRLVGLLDKEIIKDGFVVREKDAYPTYYTGYEEHLGILKNYLSGFSNLQIIGRAGMYKYNNQDHALLTGLLAARKFLRQDKNIDLWAINADDEYLEMKKS